MRRDILLDLTTIVRPPQFQCINAGTPLERARQNARSKIIIISKLIYVIGKKKNATQKIVIIKVMCIRIEFQSQSKYTTKASVICNALE